MDEFERNYFYGIVDYLKGATHPEVFHKRYGNHPGDDWYLKTVCPMPDLRQVDSIGYGALWKNVQVNHPNEVTIVPYAYDWNGKEIPYMASIWIRNDSDVILKLDPIEGVKVVLVDRDVGNTYYSETLYELIDITREAVDWFDNKDEIVAELEILDAIASNMAKGQGEIDEAAKKKFTLLDGGRDEDE